MIIAREGLHNAERPGMVDMGRLGTTQKCKGRCKGGIEGSRGGAEIAESGGRWLFAARMTSES